MDKTAILEKTELDLVVYPQYFPLGEQVIIVQFEKKISISVNQNVLFFTELVNKSKIPGVTQIIPTFCSLAIRYNPLVLNYREMIGELHKLKEMMAIEKESVCQKGKTIHIPVVYGGEYGPDLEYVAEKTGIEKEEVIRLHTSHPHFIYMLGVVGSFPYCGDLDKRLALKRRSSPRVRVEKGSIVIANQLTVIHPLASPSGWHIIGRTPMDTFNPLQDPPSILLAGDYVKFVSVSEKEAGNWSEYKQREWNEKWNL